MNNRPDPLGDLPEDWQEQEIAEELARQEEETERLYEEQRPAADAQERAGEPDRLELGNEPKHISEVLHDWMRKRNIP